jgi:hypothetical protein
MHRKRAFTFLYSGTEKKFVCQMFSGLTLFSGTGIVEVNVYKENVNTPVVED